MHVKNLDLTNLDTIVLLLPPKAFVRVGKQNLQNELKAVLPLYGQEKRFIVAMGSFCSPGSQILWKDGIILHIVFVPVKLSKLVKIA